MPLVDHVTERLRRTGFEAEKLYDSQVGVVAVVGLPDEKVEELPLVSFDPTQHRIPSLAG